MSAKRGQRDHFRGDQHCGGRSQEHHDAVALVELLIKNDGRLSAPQMEIARRLNMWIEFGSGIRKIDTGRFNRARNHVRDRIAQDGLGPCCGFTLHYRRSGAHSALTLVDPSGSIGHHATAAIETVNGWISRERQHHTENRRMVETLELLGDHVLAHNDRVGYRLIQRGAIELEEYGTITPTTMAEMVVWAGAAS